MTEEGIHPLTPMTYAPQSMSGSRPDATHLEPCTKKCKVYVLGNVLIKFGLTERK